MRKKDTQAINSDEYGYANRELGKTFQDHKLNVNDLLNRIKNEKKVDRKVNLLILSGAFSVAAIFLLILAF